MRLNRKYLGVRVELAGEGGGQTDPIHAEISRERFRELKLVAGERVFIRPRRFDLFPSQLHWRLMHDAFSPQQLQP